MSDQDYFVDVLGKDPANIPDMILLNGFLGASTQAEHVRLYLNAVLNEYLEIPLSAILHQEKIPAGPGQALAAHYVWLRADTALMRQGKNTTAHTIQFSNPSNIAATTSDKVADGATCCQQQAADSCGT